MKTLTLFPLHGYWARLVGFAVLTVATVPLLVKLLTYWIPAATKIQLPGSDVLLWTIGLGLAMVTFSKERKENEDERTRQVRYTAFRSLAMIYFIVAFFLFAPFSMGFELSREILIGAFFILPLVCYQIVYNICLYTSGGYTYTDGTARGNITPFIIISIAVILIGLYALILIGQAALE